MARRRRRSVSPKKKAQLKARGVLRTSLDPLSARYDSFLKLTDQVTRILSDAGLLVEEQDTTKQEKTEGAGDAAVTCYKYAVLEYVGRWRPRGDFLFDTAAEATAYITALGGNTLMCVSPCLVLDPEAID